MSQCGKCVAKITNALETISCVECKSIYHITCVNMRSAKLSSTKNTWKCELCASETSSNSSRKSDSSKEQAASMATIIQGITDLRKDMTQQFGGVITNVAEVKTQLASVNETVTSMKKQLDYLAIENETRKKEHQELMKENANLKTEVALLRNQVQDIEQYSRKDNIEVVGVPLSQNENIYAVVDSIAKVLDVSFNVNEISIAHRLPDTKKDGKPNIIVKFVARYAKHRWINAARNCKKLTAAELNSAWKPTKIYLNDHLTFTNKRLLGQLRGLVREKRIVSAWSRDCKVMMRVRTEGPVYHIRQEQDIEKALSDSK